MMFYRVLVLTFHFLFVVGNPIQTKTSCGENHFMCRNGRCIPNMWVCDNDRDCSDGDDELNCNVICNADQFTCPEDHGYPKSCIPIAWKCDGQRDCIDYSDEKNCSKPSSHCTSNEFQCANGECIYNSWVCDGDDDCGDNSDEKTQGCVHACNVTDRFKCKTTNACIPRNWVCDGEPDCRDHSDEFNCTDRPSLVRQCFNYEIKCRSGGYCIHKNWRCDGELDCPDGSDEDECNYRACNSSEFSCDLGKCIPLSKKCDGVEDCVDGKDELNCTIVPTKSITCDPFMEHQCEDDPQHCIPYEDLCVENRPNNDCVQTVCNKKIEICNGHEYCKCRTTSHNGTICHCPRGFNVLAGICEDINECNRVGICSQICINLPGGFKCQCHSGFHLVYPPFRDTSGDTPNHARMCRAEGGDPILFLSNRLTLRRYNLVTRRYGPLIENLSSAVALDFLYKNNTLIWSDVSNEKIKICYIGERMRPLKSIDDCVDGANKTTLIDEEIFVPDGLAVDWVHQLLFWTDAGHDQISVVDLTSRMRKTLISKDLDEPRAIAVDPLRGVIFWTDWGKKPRIERSGMDGQDRAEVIFGDSVKWPNGLALDILEQRIYWADAKVKLIMSSDYWGSTRRLVLRSHHTLKHPFSLAIFEDRIYWTDWDFDGVLSVNKFTGGDHKTLMTGLSGPMALRVYHQLAQPDHPNKCLNHDCQQLCLPKALIGEFRRDTFVLVGKPYTCACMNKFVVNAANPKECLSENHENLEEHSPNSSFSSKALLMFILISLIAVVGYIVYRRKSSHFTILNVDNPVYRRTVEGMEADMEGFPDGVAVQNGNGNTLPPKLVLDESKTQYNPPIVPPSSMSAGTSVPTESLTAPLTSSMVI